MHLTMIAASLPARAQTAGSFLNNAAGKLGSQPAAEKVYLHLNKANYDFGDTIWYKAYTVVGQHHQLSALSGVLYVELISPKDSLVTRQILPLVSGVAWSDVPLAKTLPQGSYRIRAYTTWMRNAGYFYDQRIMVGGVAPMANTVKAAEKPDVQFFPEGGILVSGVRSRVAFKAVGSQGTGEDVKGTIEDNEGNVVADFATQHLGMGVFAFTPQSGKIYKAKIAVTSEAGFTIDLPKASEEGYTLTLNNEQEDSILIKIAVNEQTLTRQKSSTFYITGQSGGKIYYTSQGKLEGLVYTAKVDKSRFPTGIAQFTLFTQTGEPVAERIVFIRGSDLLNLDISAPMTTYATGQQVKLNLAVRDSKDKPVTGSFSASVVNEGNTENKNTESTILNNLLLTQGWVSYEPADPTPQYEAEKEFVVKGTVKNVFSKPVKGTKVLLFSKSPVIIMDTLTDDQGRFIFNQFPRVDTPIFILKAVNKNGKSFNVGLNVDETVPPTFNSPKMPIMVPWYVNSDSTLLNFTHTNSQAKQLQFNPQGGHVLKEVKITAKKIIKGSQNLNGPGNADIVLDEKDLEKAGKKTFLDLLRENVKGFREGMFLVDSYLQGDRAKTDRILSGFVTDGPSFKTNQSWYFIDDKPIKFIVDGVPIYRVLPNPTVGNPFNAIVDITNYLKSHSAEDIKGIEVNITSKYTTRYASGINPASVSFVEITTRSGNGPGITNTPGVYLYKPLAISYPAQFYKPKYIAKDTTNRLLDLRSTIDWEPNIVTDKNGEATIKFYTADKPSTYTIIAEGTDMNGSLGYKTARIIVGKTKDKAK